MKNFGRLPTKVFFSTIMFLATWTISHAQGNEQVGHYHSFTGGTQKTVFGCFELTRNKVSLDMNHKDFNSWFLSGDKITYLNGQNGCGSASITIELPGNGKVTVGNSGKACLEFSSSEVTPKQKNGDCEVLSRKVAPSPTFLSLLTDVWDELTNSKASSAGSQTKGCVEGTQYLSEGWSEIYIRLDNSCGGFNPKNGGKAQMQSLNGCGENAKMLGNPTNLNVSSDDIKWAILSAQSGSQMIMVRGNCYQLNVPTKEVNHSIQIKIEVVAVDQFPSGKNGLKLEYDQRFATLAGVGKN